MDSFGRTSRSLRNMRAAPISPGCILRLSFQYDFRSSACLLQTVFSCVVFFASIESIIRSDARTSPTTATLAVWFLPISAGSTSMCIILSRFSKSSTVPTERSENRVPTASTQSASTIILLASACPCIPIGPMESG